MWFTQYGANRNCIFPRTHWFDGKNNAVSADSEGATNYDGREINRHNFDEKEIAAAAETEVVKRLVDRKSTRLNSSH